MDGHSTKVDERTAANGTGLFTGAAWFDPIEAGLRERIRGFTGELLKEVLTAALGGRAKHARAAAADVPLGCRKTVTSPHEVVRSRF